jgi:mannose-6-phosphate isomerase-like protein (cupin superfamily)
MPETTTAPIITPSGEGKVWKVAGDQITCKGAGEQTGGGDAVMEEASPPNGGPPLHVHERTDEIFYVLGGEYEVTCGDRTMRVAEGTMFIVPKQVPHALRNIRTTTSRVLVTLIPAGFEKFFEAADGVVDRDQLIQIAGRYDVKFVSADDA